LKEKCRPVEHFDDGLKALAENMLETMYAAEGIGLAANSGDSKKTSEAVFSDVKINGQTVAFE